MPIYEYQCQNCGNEQEVLQKLSDAPLVDCAACGQPAMKKKVSAAAFRLKGGGWYETDFKTGDKKNLAGDGGSKDAAGKSGDSAGGSGDSAKGDAKGETKKAKSESKQSA
ncbi:MAG: zinc ribbon domain-containing protein [Halioglobus sp.]|nr:zinc ribbon domain-containing protein [Halioglobus sp.]